MIHLAPSSRHLTTYCAKRMRRGWQRCQTSRGGICQRCFAVMHWRGGFASATAEPIKSWVREYMRDVGK